jgi:hypothetical protein
MNKYLEDYKIFLEQNKNDLVKIQTCKVIYILDSIQLFILEYIYTKDYRKQLLPHIKHNCEQIHQNFKNSEFKLSYNISDRSVSKDNIGEFSKMKSTNFITFECDIGSSKKKERMDSDSSSSEDEENHFKKSVSKFDDNIEELLKKDFGYD